MARPKHSARSAPSTDKKSSKKSKVPEKKPRRRHPGTRAKSDVRAQQKKVDFLMQMAPFNRIVRTILAELNTRGTAIRVAKNTMGLLQHLVEAQMVTLMKKSTKIAAHASRQTVTDKDMQIAQL